MVEIIACLIVVIILGGLLFWLKRENDKAFKIEEQRRESIKNYLAEIAEYFHNLNECKK